MVDYGTLSIVLTGIGIIGAIVYYTLTLRNATKTRQAQLFMQIYNRFNTREFVEQMNYLRFKWSIPQLEDWSEFFTSEEYQEDFNIVASTVYFFEGVGVLVSKGLIDVELVDDLMSGPLTHIWERMLPFNDSARAVLGQPAAEWYEFLYNKVKPIREKQHLEQSNAS
jgi:hypothetical protein